jgi:hypothetical protein
MASFGRRQRHAVSLTSQIASLAKQAQNDEWQNIQDAWKNGGTVKDANGNDVKVTDQYILDYIASRRDEISDPTDPEWINWNNAHDQLAFGISESKIQLRFKQGKVSATQVANFYKSQLHNYPSDSEVYRTIAGRAADWAKSTAASASNAAKAKVINGLNARWLRNATTRAGFADMEAAVTAAAIAANLIGPNQGIDKIKPEDMPAFQKLLQNGVRGQGNTVYGLSDWQDGLTAFYGSLNDDIAADTQAAKIDSSYANKANTAKKDQSDFADAYMLPMNTLGTDASLAVASDQLQKALDSAQGNPAAEKAAYDKYKATLSGILADSKSASTDPLAGAVDPAVEGDIQQKIDALNGTYNATGGSGDSDASDLADSIKGLAAVQTEIDQGRGYYGQKSPGAPLGYVPNPGGPTDPVTSHPEMQPVQVSANGVTSTAWMMGAPQYTGDPTNKSTWKFVGYTFYGDNGKPVQYGVVDASGNIVFTNRNPFGATLSTNGMGFSNPGTLQSVSGPGQTSSPGAIAGTLNMDLNTLVPDFTVADKAAAFSAGNDIQAQLHGVVPQMPGAPGGESSAATASTASGTWQPNMGIDPRSLLAPVEGVLSPLAKAFGALPINPPTQTTTPVVRLPNLPAFGAGNDVQAGLHATPFGAPLVSAPTPGLTPPTVAMPTLQNPADQQASDFAAGNDEQARLHGLIP